MPDSADPGLVARFSSISGNYQPSDNMRLFLEQAPPEVADRFLSMLDVISGAPHLEPRIKALIRVVVCMVIGHELGVKSWSRSALASGATPEEVIEAMYTVIPQVGAIPIVRMLPAALSATREVGGATA
jgi:alkylhydroperoxidase/carboxymuconolactone decarboxylase family protein YurZ